VLRYKTWMKNLCFHILTLLGWVWLLSWDKRDRDNKKKNKIEDKNIIIFRIQDKMTISVSCLIDVKQYKIKYEKYLVYP